MVVQAERHGARIVTGWPVAQVEATATGYRLDTGDGRTLDAERVVVTAGGWLPALLDRLPLPSSFRALVPPLQVSQENAYHFPYRDVERPTAPTMTSWPTFIHKNPTISAYGLPGGRDAGFRGQKIAEFLGGRRIASAADQDGVVDPANRARIVDYVRQYLPGLRPRAVRRDDLPVHQHPERGLPRRRHRRHHAGLPLLRARRQVRPTDRRHRRRRGHRRGTRPRPVHGTSPRCREPRPSHDLMIDTLVPPAIRGTLRGSASIRQLRRFCRTVTT